MTKKIAFASFCSFFLLYSNLFQKELLNGGLHQTKPFCMEFCVANMYKYQLYTIIVTSFLLLKSIDDNI